MTGRNQEDQEDLKKEDPHGKLAYFRVFAPKTINMLLTGEYSAHVYKNSSNKHTYNSKPNALRPTLVHDLFEKEIS